MLALVLIVCVAMTRLTQRHRYVEAPTDGLVQLVPFRLPGPAVVRGQTLAVVAVSAWRMGLVMVQRSALGGDGTGPEEHRLCEHRQEHL